MWFTNKKGILERCEKDEKDVRWLDRAIKKGLVIHDLDMGYITSGDYIEELELRVEELKRGKKSEVVESLNSKEVEGLKERLGYVWGRLEEVNGCLARVKERFANSKAQWTSDKFNSEFGYKMDEREASEREWAEENGII